MNLTILFSFGRIEYHTAIAMFICTLGKYVTVPPLLKTTHLTIGANFIVGIHWDFLPRFHKITYCKNSAPGRTRTDDPRIKSSLRLPTALQEQMSSFYRTLTAYCYDRIHSPSAGALLCLLVERLPQATYLHMKSVVVYAQSMLTLLVRVAGLEPARHKATDFLTTLCHHSHVCVVVWTMSLPCLSV